jgi:DNA end-binding protein Ku
MARAIWSGSLSFGLVNIPVQLVSAVVDRGLHFHQLHDADLARIREQRICSKDGEVVPLAHILKGYEVSKTTSVPVTAQELEALAPEKSRSIAPEAFVPLEDINPVYFQHPYYLLPGQGADAAYALLRGALEHAKRVGIARMVMRGKEDLVAVRPIGQALSLSVLWFFDEVINPSKLEGLPRAAKVPDKQLELARQIVDSLSAAFEPEHYHDEYRERVLELVRKKSKGQKIEKLAPAPAPKSNVVDLMAALKASLGSSGRAGKAAPKGQAQAASTRSRAAPKPGVKRASSAARRAHA